MIVRVGKRIVSGAFLMIEFGITHLRSSGNSAPRSVKVRILQFACRGYLCILLIDTICIFPETKALCDIVYSALTASVPYCVSPLS